jgi:hypothetical protein
VQRQGKPIANRPQLTKLPHNGRPTTADLTTCVKLVNISFFAMRKRVREGIS